MVRNLVPNMTNLSVYSCEHDGRHYAFSLTELRYLSQEDFDADAAEGFEQRHKNLPMFEIAGGTISRSGTYTSAPFGVVIVYTKADLETKTLSDIKLDPVQAGRALLVKLPVIDLSKIADEYFKALDEQVQATV